MKSKKLFIALIALASLTISSCSNDSEDDLMDNDPQNDLVTYRNTVKAIIDGSCLNCHSNPPTNGAPFALTNYDQVSQRASGVLNAMARANGASRAMPPAGRLPQSTIDKIDQWIKDGTLE